MVGFRFAQPTLHDAFDRLYFGKPSTMYCRDVASRRRTAAIFT
jgi:hypothetical protein